MKYWISWYSKKKYKEFEICNPWWYSGSRCSDGAVTICAALIASSEEDAKEQIYKAYDIRPKDIEFRFCDLKEDCWSPFNSRFQRKDWMVWEEVKE